MTLSLVSTAVLRASEAGAEDPALPAWAVGLIALGILLALLLALIAFGGGREHS
ncbi:hypothetical protein [Nocardioides sp.]|uniref:hypothetical protein n=1 Tax=Nocardioides sp. TaxID=35761 RepID=UPI0035182BC8